MEMEPLHAFGVESKEKHQLEPVESEHKPSRLNTAIVIFCGLAAFVFFLVMKLPETRIQNLIIAHARIFAQEQRLLFSAEKVRIGVFFGPALKMYNVELKNLDDEKQSLKIPYLRIRPSFLSLLSKTKKAGISAEMLGGEISGTVGASASSLVLDLDLRSLDLGSTTLLKKFVPVEFKGKVKGQVALDLDLEQIQKSDGAIKLNLQKLYVPAQSAYGFNLPKLSVEDTKVDISIVRGQILIRSFEMGKDTKTDDIVARLTGDGALDRILDRSRINVKAVFQISPAVMQGFPFIDALLAPAKMPDGRYSYRLSGPIMNLEAVPGT